jgi:hypothetical protein
MPEHVCQDRFLCPKASTHVAGQQRLTKTHRAGTSGNVILAQIGFKAVRLMQPQIQCQTMGNYSQQITSMPGQ